MSNNARDVVVIGGGIVGSMTSYLLAKRGLSVTMLEPDALGSHASGLAFGGLDPLQGMGLPEPLLDFSLHCFTRHQDMARELRDATGIDHHFQTRDRLYLAFDEDDVKQYDVNLAWMKNVEMFSVSWVDGETVRRLEPKVNPACIGAMYQQGAASVDAHSLTMAAARAAEQQGTELVLQTGYRPQVSRQPGRCRHLCRRPGRSRGGHHRHGTLVAGAVGMVRRLFASGASQGADPAPSPGWSPLRRGPELSRQLR